MRGFHKLWFVAERHSKHTYLVYFLPSRRVPPNIAKRMAEEQWCILFENTLLLFLCSLYVLQEEIWDCILDVIVKAGFLTLSESIAVFFFPLRFASYCCSNENWNRWRLPLLLLRVSIKKPFKCIIASFFANQFTYNIAALYPSCKMKMISVE